VAVYFPISSKCCKNASRPFHKAMEPTPDMKNARAAGMSVSAADKGTDHKTRLDHSKTAGMTDAEL
jgi:hypothetical protein